MKKESIQRKLVKQSEISSPMVDFNESTKSLTAKKIHPIIIYPFTQPDDYSHLTFLYENLIKKLNKDDTKYVRPITVINRQTHYNNAKYMFNHVKRKKFIEFRKETIENYSDILDAWCVDSCQMWLAGFGEAFDKKSSGEDVYWLIPGDFDYNTENGKFVLDKMIELPDAVFMHEQDMCIGEIEIKKYDAKQLIDTYGTYGLLYNWFPYEAQEIRKITDKPRSEFFALSHSFLREVLRQRWYAYEQTIVILLHGIVGKKRINKIFFNEISDLPQGRESLAAAMQQVERTERVLKLVWRERYEKHDAQWHETFRKLDTQSEQIRGAALVILQNLLR
jgi:hypothetical protein